MNFYSNGWPWTRFRVGPDLGLSYWSNGWPVAGAAQAIADAGSLTITMHLFVPLMTGTVAALVVPTRVTQLARQVATEESQPGVRVTQLGRQGVTEEANPGIRVTQIARQVLYPFTCVAVPVPEECPIVDLSMAPAGIDCPTQDDLTASAGTIDGCALTTDIGTD